MKKHSKEIIAGFLTGVVVAILAILVIPKVVGLFSKEPENKEVTIEMTEEIESRPVEPSPVRTTTTNTDRPRREQCLFSGCNNERNESSRYCDLHDNGYRPKKRSAASGTEKTTTIDDQDIDSYYLDYQDEFEDIDDAWDDLEDNEDEWDDY